MDSKQAKALKVGDKVIWDGDPEDRGEVIKVWGCGLHIRWENGTGGAIHVNDCEQVTAAREAAGK